MTTTNLTRRAFVGSLGAASLTLAACGGSSQPAFDGALTGTYDMHVAAYDWGCGVDKITMTLNATVDNLDVDSLVVTEHKQATDWTAEDFPVIVADFPRNIITTSVADNIVTLELECTPNDGSPFLYTMATGYNTWCDPYELNIALAEGVKLTSNGTEVTSIAVEPVAKSKTTDADMFATDSYKCADGIVYPYAYFAPEDKTETLFVWLHGAGEGGTEATDPYVTCLANKVTAFAGEEFQQTVGGAHIVVPQCPTIWMDLDGTSTYITAENSKEVKSFYTESLEEFIDAYAEKIGATKIVLAGCSNGGFMTEWLGMRRPDKYACVVPICEAVYDVLISDEQIKAMVDLPMFFIYCLNDNDVIPSTCEEPTIKRLKEAGKTDETLHVFTCDKVIDTSGTFKNEDGTPYEYATHWSWIYFDNNEAPCNDDGLAAWDFIAQYVK